MFLSAFGASKPLGPGNDPSYSSVQFLQTFDGLIPGTFPEPFSSEKSGTQWTNIDPPNEMIQVVSTPSRFGYAGKILQPEGVLHSPVLSGSEFAGDFTFEFSMYLASADEGLSVVYSDFIGASGGYFALVSDNLKFAFTPSSTGVPVSTDVSIATNTWFDFAVARSGSLVRVFINGVLRCSFTSTISVYSWSLVSRMWVIDDLRASNVCRYTTNYTPSHPFLNQ